MSRTAYEEGFKAGHECCQSLVKIKESHIQSLEAKLKVAVDALSFYADGSNLRVYDEGIREHSNYGDRYFGELAREALKQIKGEET
jgi:hypothetical protein